MRFCDDKRRMCAGAVVLAAALGRCAAADAEDIDQIIGAPLIALDRKLMNTGGRSFWPTGQDYNGDNVHDLLARVDASGAIRMRVLSGLSGVTLRQYDPPPASYPNWVFARGASLPDSDGDGKRELLLGDPVNVWAPKSSAGGGRADLLPQVFSFGSLPFGQHFATSDRSAVIASGDESKLLFVDARTGQVQARISNNVSYGNAVGSLGQSAVNLGDITGDGIDDFASSGGNVNHFPAATGSLFLINGAVSTSGSSYVPLQSLPAGSVLAELSGVQFMGSGSAGGWENTTVNLGDPHPGNSATEFLIVTGSPWANYETGGMAAHLLTRQPNGTFTSQLVASYQPSAKWHYGAELVNLGDITGDAVSDLALLVEQYGIETQQQTGRIQILDGAGLLNGFDPALDVLQNIDGLPAAFFYGSMQSLGDYDHDGHFEFAASVLYNGQGGQYGYGQHVYQVIPEPAFLLPACAIAFALRPRRRRGREIGR